MRLRPVGGLGNVEVQLDIALRQRRQRQQSFAQVRRHGRVRMAGEKPFGAFDDPAAAGEARQSSRASHHGRSVSRLVSSTRLDNDAGESRPLTWTIPSARAAATSREKACAERRLRGNPWRTDPAWP